MGAVLLALITVALAGVLLAGAGTATLDHAESNFVTVSATAEPDGTVILTHESGKPVDVDHITVEVTVNGERLAEQPPVPFFSERGFETGPTGPFNTAADQEWILGEDASFTIGDSNSPAPTAGDRIEVPLYRDGHPFAEATTSVPGDGG